MNRIGPSDGRVSRLICRVASYPCELVDIECRRVLHRYRLAGDLDDDGFLEALKRLKDVLSGISILLLSPGVKNKASGSFPVAARTRDALHLASALVFSEADNAESVLIFSHDRGMNRCAEALGFATPFG